MSNNNLDANNLENALSLEKAFDEIDELIAQLEKPDNTLEASFQAFEKGMQVVKYCNESIDQVEKKAVKQQTEHGEESSLSETCDG